VIRQIVFRPAAVEDVVNASAWYEAHAPGLGEDLVDEILKAMRRAQDNPELFRIVLRGQEVRRVLTNRFPYRIFFSIADDTLYVHTVLHGARRDGRWTERL
jgi:plasmid stabilization system protein ParE